MMAFIACRWPLPFGGGWLLFQAQTLREEELKGMLLFARELSSFLENRAFDVSLGLLGSNRWSDRAGKPHSFRSEHGGSGNLAG